MIRNIIILLSIAAAAAACKSDDTNTKGETPPAVKTVNPETQPTDPDIVDPSTDPPAAESSTFGGLVHGATKLTVTQRQADGDIDFGGQDRVVNDAEWIAKFVDTIGVGNEGSDAVPKCIPSYTLVFASDDGELAAFDGVCAGTDTVVLVREMTAYAADDAEAARALLKELAAQPTTEAQ